MKLHAKLVVTLVPLIALPMVAFGWFAFTQQRDSVQAESLRQLHTAIEQVDRQAAARLEAARADVLLFSKSNVLARYLLVDDEAQRYRLMQPAMLKLFATYQDANPEYREIRILLPDGYEDTRSTIGELRNLTEEEGDSPFFDAIRSSGEDTLTQVVRSEDLDAPVILISRPVLLRDFSVDPVLAAPTLRGYLVVTIDISFITRHSEDLLAGLGGHVFYTDDGGRVLFSSTQDEHAELLPVEQLDALRRSAPSGIVLRLDHEGEPYRMTGRRLHDNLFVVAALPERTLLDSTTHLTRVAAALTLASVAVTAALLYAILRSLLLSPLERLRQATREIARGNLGTEVGIRRDDEIGDLARSFDDMGRSLRESHEQVAFLAYHDSLTGLPNRRLFGELLEREIAHSHRHAQVLAILFLDLDDFKRVNDSLGHQAGDVLLEEVAGRLSAVVTGGESDAGGSGDDRTNVVARLGGDEFIVLLSELHSPMQAAEVACRILDELARPFDVADDEICANASVGIATYPVDGTTADTLIKNADIAMYQAKAEGKRHYQFYAESMNRALVGRLAMERALREALAEDEFLLHYQPQVDTQSGAVIGVEALVRWHSPDVGLVAPGEFIPVAEDTGLIVPIGEWVLLAACRQFRAWQQQGVAPEHIAVNISARQFVRTDLEAAVRAALASSELDARHLDIELTETSVMQAPEQAAQTLRALKALGVKISLDDFGMGYSSLSALKRLPIDRLKIDHSFVRDIASDDDDAAITSTIIAMGRSMNLEVIAEGVEQEEQLDFLRSRGCDLVQGYLISRPVDAGRMTAMLSAFAERAAATSAPPAAHGRRADTRPRAEA